jgi:hypothetical protein
MIRKKPGDGMILKLLAVAFVVGLILSASVACFSAFQPEKISGLGNTILGSFKGEERTGDPGVEPQGGGAEGGGGTPD